MPKSSTDKQTNKQPCVGYRVLFQLDKVDMAPSWEDIRVALVALLSRFDLDLSQIGATPRLSYEQLELIFYHLMLLVDSNYTKRRFRNIYPAKSKEDQNRFLDTAVQMINDKQLSQKRITISNLRMSGGEPFRSLLESVIYGAMRREQESSRKRFGCDLSLIESSNHKTNTTLEDRLDFMEQLKQEVQDNLEEVERSRRNLETSKETVGEKMRSLSIKLDLDLTSCKRENLQNIRKALLTRLENAAATCKANSNAILEIPIETLQPSEEQSLKSKRTSQLIREARVKLEASEGENIAPEDLRKRLAHLDVRVCSLLNRLQDKQEKANDALLEDPQNLKLYEKFQSEIPLILLPHDCRPNVADLERILSYYPDPNYDDKEIVEVFKRLAEQ